VGVGGRQSLAPPFQLQWVAECSACHTEITCSIVDWSMRSLLLPLLLLLWVGEWVDERGISPPQDWKGAHRLACDCEPVASSPHCFVHRRKQHTKLPPAVEGSLCAASCCCCCCCCRSSSCPGRTWRWRLLLNIPFSCEVKG